jgi:hypothetical protein
MKTTSIKSDLGNLIFTLKKTGAKSYYKIYEDIDDPWFIYVLYIDKKTNSVKRNSMMIAKDIPSYLELLRKDNWVETIENKSSYNFLNKEINENTD